MDSQLTADYCRSASNSPTAAKKFGFHLSLPRNPRQWSSQDELAYSGKDASLNPAKYRSVSVGDILDEGSAMVDYNGDYYD